MKELLDDRPILGTKARAHAGVNNLEGTGIIEARVARSSTTTKVDDNGAHDLAKTDRRNRPQQLAQLAGRPAGGKGFRRRQQDPGRRTLNRVSGAVRAYDPASAARLTPLGHRPLAPCSCKGRNGQLLDEVRSE